MSSCSWIKFRKGGGCTWRGCILALSSVQFSCSVVSDSLQPCGLQHMKPSCPSPTSGSHWGPVSFWHKNQPFYGQICDMMIWCLCHSFWERAVGKEFANNAGDLGSIPGLGRSPGEEHGNPLQWSCLESPVDRGAWWATYTPLSLRVELDWATRTLSFSYILGFFLILLWLRKIG